MAFVYERGDRWEEAEKWGKIIERFPKLSQDAGVDHMQVAFRGELLPFAEARLQRSALPGFRIAFSAEVTGPPKLGKTAFLNYADYTLGRLHIGHEVFSEGEVGFPAELDPQTFNMCLQLRSVALLAGVQVLSRSYQEYLVNRIKLFDRLIFNAMPYEYAQSQIFSKNPGPKPYGELTTQLIRDFSTSVDAVLIFNAPAKVSLERGSRMKESYLSDLSQGYARLPQDIAEITADSYRPLAIINIDAEGKMERYHDKALRSTGTLLKAMWEMYPETKDELI